MDVLLGAVGPAVGGVADPGPVVEPPVLERHVVPTHGPVHARIDRPHDAAAEVLAFPNLRRVGRRRSEEHTSELQSRPHLVCRLLLEKKKHTLCLVWIAHELLLALPKYQTLAGVSYHNSGEWGHDPCVHSARKPEDF